ncbi:MFS general substrate transporter [Annulohypoxylon maeteangense]|uniref:MFS general substrate transporter n=1 Tax=Annulohypoxylon maeteangense TaxID=1927788 RepID=UPI002008756B|nr:MFS general substrate transporter [Annulohypoxylon maeteangense]KAI0880508.1 MFS general substrate transporter [Annulohypoxylon maeteangense]
MAGRERAEELISPSPHLQMREIKSPLRRENLGSHTNEILKSGEAAGDDASKDIESREKGVQTVEPPYSVFTHREKAAMIITVSFMAIISPLSSAIYLPVLPSLAQDLNVSASLINLTVTTYLIFQGVAPSFIGNYSDTYGRRPAYMICSVIYLGANIGLAVQNSYAALLVLRCLQSCGSSATIALASAVSADLATRAERGKYLGYAAMGVTLGPALGPVIGGLINQYLGWRAIFWFLTILSGVLFLILFLFLPETGRSVVGNGSIPSPWWNMSLLAYIKQRGQGITPDTTTAKPPRRRPNPFASLKLLFEKQGGIILAFGSLVYGGYYMLLTTLSTELSTRFGFSSVIIGVCYLPLGIGSLSYRHTGGYLLDWNFRRHARVAGIAITKNRQQDLAALPIEKMRLQISLPFVYLACAAVVGYGWAMQTRASLAGIEVCLFLCGLFISGITNALNTLIVDTHVSSPATAVAANNLCRCLVGAGAAAVASPLIDRIGVGWTAVFVAGLWVILSPLLWLVIVKGPKWRQVESGTGDKGHAEKNAKDGTCR